MDFKTPVPHLGGQGSTPWHFTQCVCVFYVKLEALFFKILRNFLSTYCATIVRCVIVRNCQQVIEISFLVWDFASDSSHEQNQSKEVNFMLLVGCIFLHSLYCQQIHL